MSYNSNICCCFQRDSKAVLCTAVYYCVLIYTEQLSEIVGNALVYIEKYKYRN